MGLYSYFIEQLLKKPNKASAQSYLGITTGGGSGIVTSIGITPTSPLQVTGSPVTIAGNIGISLGTKNANTVLSGPTTGAAAAPAFRALVEDDIPSITEAKFSFSDVTTANATNAQHGLLPKLSNVSSEFLNGTGAFSTPPGSGTVTSVAMTVPSFLSVAGSPVTTSGTLAVSLANQSANLVFSGPSSGGAATPTFRSLVEADTTLSDITTNDVSTTKHGYCPKGSGVAGEFLNSSGAWATPTGGSDWDTVITKSSDQTVTNNATPQNDSELSVSVDASSYYLVQLILIYNGNNTTGDYRCRFTFPTLAISCLGSYNYRDTALTASIGTGVSGTTQWPSPDLAIGVNASANPHSAFFQFTLCTNGSGTLQYQFANNSAGSGRTSTTMAGSTLRVKKLYP